MAKIPEILKPKIPDFSSNIYISASYQLSGSVLGLSLLGWWIDSTYATSPTWLMTLSITGIIVGFYSFFKTIIDEDKRKQREKDRMDENK
jgi:F0F1-type ATP synthase assembly protein I